MAGLFDGFVQENPTFVDNSEKYAKRAELARDRAVEAENAVSVSEAIVRNEAAAVKAVGERVDASEKNIEAMNQTVQSNKDLVVAKTEEVVQYHELVEMNKDVVVEKHADVVVKHADVVSMHSDVGADADATHSAMVVAQTSASVAVESEASAKKAEAVILSNISITSDQIEVVEAVQEEVIGLQDEANTSAQTSTYMKELATVAKNEAQAAKTLAESAKEGAAASEALAKMYADGSYELYEELRKGQIYRGPWNPADNQAYPDNKGTNSIWDVILSDGQLTFEFDGKTWLSGDRLVYVSSDSKYYRVGSASTVLGVNGKTGFVSLNATDVGALSDSDTEGAGGKVMRVGGPRDNQIAQALANTTGGAYVSAEAPADPFLGMRWFDTTDGRTYIWFIDADSSQWVEENPQSPDAITHSQRVNDFANKGIVDAEKVVTPVIHFNNTEAQITNTDGNPIVQTTKLYHANLFGNAQQDTYIVFNDFLRARHRDVDYRIYHEGLKPTAEDVGALPITGGIVPGAVTVGFLGHTALPNNNPQILTASADGTVYLGNPTSVNDIRLETTTGNANVSVGSTNYRIYHQGYKPTPADVGALPITGGTLTGDVNIVGPNTGINFTNINGDTSIVNGTGDGAEQDKTNLQIKSWFGVGIAPTAGNDSLTDNNLNSVWIDARNGRISTIGDIYTNTDKKVYHEGHKPTYSDVGALPATEDYGSFQVSKPIVATSGFVAQSTNTSLSIEANPDALPYIASKTPGESGPSKAVVFSDTTIDVKKNMQVSGGVIDIVGPNSNIIQFHQPGQKAVLAYQPAGQEAFRIAGSNGGFSETVAIAQFDKDNAALIGKVSTSYSRNRSWVDKGNVAFLSQQKNVQPGFLVGHISGVGHMPGVHLTEHGLGVLYNTSFDDTAHVLWGVDEKDWTSIWQFKNGGEMSTPSGTRIEKDGNLYGAVWGGNYISSWVQFNFAPISDIKHKRIVGESKLSALGQIEKMKFHEFVWKDTDVTKQLTKRDMKLNRIGVIAQELEAIDPTYTRDIETYAEDGTVAESTKVLDTANLLAVALKAIQELQEEVAALKAAQ